MKEIVVIANSTLLDFSQDKRQLIKRKDFRLINDYDMNFLEFIDYDDDELIHESNEKSTFNNNDENSLTSSRRNQDRLSLTRFRESRSRFLYCALVIENNVRTH